MLSLKSACTLLVVLSLPGQAQFAPLKTKLKARTAAEFQSYAQLVELALNRRWNGKGPYLEIDSDPARRDRVMHGEVVIHASVEPNPRPIFDGLIHDWYGAAYMPGTDMAKVLKVLQDFDRHAAIYPPVIKSRLIKRSGNEITGYWRLEQKGQLLPAVFDVTQTVTYRTTSPDTWTVVSHANDIRAVEAAAARNEKVLPPGEGIGLMWKLYSYWTLQRVGGGVMAECRTVSLSRGMPASLAWMIRPFVNTVPRESMDSTLRSTRKAASE